MALGAIWRKAHCLQLIRASDAASPYNRTMSSPDFNLLLTLDALLAEGSVARAAQRLRLSPSAMSRALARLRETTGDPLAGQGRARAGCPRRARSNCASASAGWFRTTAAVLRPAEHLNLKQLVRTFTLRTREGFVENFGADLIARAGVEAPGVQLRFLQKPDKDSTSLRDGTVDLETGVVGKATGPELRSQAPCSRDRLDRRRAPRPPARRRRDHPFALCAGRPHCHFPARARPRADRRGPAAAGAGTAHRHDRRWLFSSVGAGPGVRPDCDGPATAHGDAAGRGWSVFPCQWQPRR